MKTFLKIAAALAIVGGSFNASTAVAVQGQQERIITFYASEDESTTNIVGQTVVYCDGSITHWGNYSLHSTVLYFNCD